MDYELHVSDLEKQEENFTSLKKGADDLVDACDSLKGKITGEISSLNKKVEDASKKISTGYDSYETWIEGYVTDLETTENTLASGIKAPALKGDFTNTFAKILIPALKSSATDEDKEAIGKLVGISYGGLDSKEAIEKPEDVSHKGLSSEEVEMILAKANSQLGTPYSSMHYGPDGEGFGCAMFVSYCYNETLFGGVSGQKRNSTGFYGSTHEFWANVANDGYEPHNKKFIEVSADEAQPGDLVAYTKGEDPYSDHKACKHIALYTGDGKIIGSTGRGNNKGVVEGTVESQAHGKDIHYLRYVGDE